ncbi:unnamed protein product [Penicillium nalgiovense]|uniref:Allergen Asp f 4 n=1 Tax=Penicillium nalgiovense TaxID=60175 RepID=A0A1V6YR44_PENNA|nr:hypothetical protein PENNAL_c0013G03896 [Penicillium nalgiovense]CAG7953058.1 unnamed protein product [Penicillium nalgiovense]CAG7960425.1 unnamed protein product [Penicillium nalgiovense]CAG7970221.1 unnamed protein product [Penicillium nalgiovense]CAG7971148.1 unnamed protein product [Penicillium nalgiovense]
MQFAKSLMLLAAFTTSTLARPTTLERRQATGSWTSTPSSDSYSTAGFGGSTTSFSSGETYAGNVGNPYGSNIISIDASSASSYKYVAQFTGSNTDSWTVAIFNKYGPDGKMTGWYGNACNTFTLAPGETKYVAFDEDTNGGFAAAKGSTIPTDSMGGYASTWGEFDFGSTTNNGWSGFDVSVIAAENAGMSIDGMKICDALGSVCSSVTKDAAVVDNAYTAAETAVGGIGANLGSGPVRLAVTIDYSG